ADNRNSCQFDENGIVAAQPDVTHKRHEDAQMAVIEASHNGYVPRFGLTHQRSARPVSGGEVLKGEDKLAGRGGVHYAVRVHLHPGIQAHIIAEGTEVLLRAKSGMGWRFSAAGFAVSLEDSVYAGEGETPRRTQQIVVTGQTQADLTTVAWELKRDSI